MEFRQFTKDDRQYFERFSSGKMGWETSFGCVWSWNSRQLHQILVHDDYTILRFRLKDRCYFSSPLARNDEAYSKAIDSIAHFCQGNGVKTRIINISEREAEFFDRDKYIVSANRNDSDYLYNTVDLTTLAGKKFHAKRNFVNRFTRLYDYNFRDYCDGDYDTVCSFFEKWQAETQHETMSYEKLAIKNAIQNREFLGLSVGILEVSGKIVGYSVGEIVGDIGHVFFEKADTEYEGVYQTLNYLFANKYLKQTRLINRQDDMGIEGLRRAKLSYNPQIILPKYHATEKTNE